MGLLRLGGPPFFRIDLEGASPNISQNSGKRLAKNAFPGIIADECEEKDGRVLRLLFFLVVCFFFLSESQS